MKHIIKRTLATVLILCMVLSVLPASAFAKKGQTLKIGINYNIDGVTQQTGEANEYTISDDGTTLTIPLPDNYKTLLDGYIYNSTSEIVTWTSIGLTDPYSALSASMANDTVTIACGENFLYPETGVYHITLNYVKAEVPISQITMIDGVVADGLMGDVYPIDRTDRTISLTAPANLDTLYPWADFTGASSSLMVLNGTVYEPVTGADYNYATGTITMANGVDLTQAFFAVYNFTSKAYDVSFDGVPEAALSGKIHTDTLTMPGVPSMEGKVGYGWRLKNTNKIIPEGGSVLVSELDMAATNTTLEFEPIYLSIDGEAGVSQYLYTFTDADRTVIYAAQLVAEDAVIKAPAAAYRTGAQFSGWEAPDGTLYAADATVPAQNANTEFQADWDWISYDINHDSDVTAQATAQYDTDVAFTVSPPAGKEVSYLRILDENDNVVLYQQTDENAFVLKMPAASVTIAPVYADLDYTVKFYADGVLVDSIAAAGGATIAVPAIPAKPGYNGKWTNELGEDVEGATVDVTADAVYTVVYTEKSYNIFYTGNTGTGMTQTNIPFGSKFTVKAYNGAVSDGQTFLAWQGQNGKTYLPGAEYVFDFTAESTLTMTPVFDNNTEYWVVKFLGEDGGVYDIQLVEKTAAAATISTPVYEPYPAAGWYDAATDTTYTDTDIPVSDDMTLTVDAPALYTIRFLAEDGSELSVQKVRAGVNPVVPAEPVVIGKTFQGWLKDGDTEPCDSSEIPAAAADCTYRAMHSTNAYTVTDDDNTATTGPTTPYFAYGEIVRVTLTVPTGSELNFIRVIGRASGKAIPVVKTDDIHFQFTMPAENVKLSAVFVTKTYRVTFKADQNIINLQDVAYNGNAVEPAPEKEGFTLTGWTDGTNEYDLGALPAVIADVTYTAVWEENSYNINLANSSVVTVPASKAAAGQSVTVTITPPEGSDLNFVSVVTADAHAIPVCQIGNNGFMFTMPASDVGVIPIFTSHIYDVQFKDGEHMLSHQSVAYEQAPIAPVLEKAGYTFAGWNDGTDTYAEVPVAKADVVYTAVWEANTYNLTYYRGPEADESEYKCILTLPDGDIVEFFNNDTLNMPTYTVADVPYGDTVVLGEAFLPGYTFLYWKDEAGHRWNVGESFTMPVGGELLTAVWEEESAESCLVRFMNEGGLYDTYLAFVGEIYQIPETDPVEAGREFLGWEYDGQIYANGGVTGFEVIADEHREMVLNAVWSDYAYQVSFVGEAVDIAPIVDLPYGEEIVLPAAPEREGYTFLAWVDTTANGACYGESTAYTVKRDTTLEALWSEDSVEYAVKFYDENGNLYDIFVVNAGESITAPVYEQGREDCEYVWVDADANLHYLGGDEIVVNGFLNLRATKFNEATYAVNINIVPDTIAEGAATISNDEYFAGETVYVDIVIPEGYALKSVTAYGLDEDGKLLPVKDGLLTYLNGTALYFFEMPATDAEVYVEFEEIPVGSSIVKFMSDGMLFDYRIVTRGTNGNAPETAPIKDGYTFLYWQSGNVIVGTGEPFAIASDAPDEIIFEAVWQQNEYMVSYDALGGIPQPEPFDAVFGEQITLADAPVLDGFRFVGWVEDSTGFLYGEGATYTVKGMVKFTARWEEIPPEEYIVRFIDAETNQIFGYEIVKEGENVLAPTGPSFTGKTFVAWVNAEDGAQLLPGNLTQPIYADTVFYATYEINTHAIVTETESCSITPAVFGQTEVGTLVEFTVDAIDRFDVTSVTISYMDGPALMVRTLTADATGIYSFYMPDADVTITAKAAQNVYAIFTNADVNSIINAPNYGTAGKTVSFTAAATNPDYEIRDVFVMTGEDQIIPVSRITSFGEATMFAFTMPAQDVTIVVLTVKTEYTVTYLDSDNTLLGIIPVNSGEYAEAPEAFKEGYVFNGWEILPNKEAFDPAADAVTESLIVRATYIGEPYTVAAGELDHVAYLQAECTIHTGNLNSSNLLITQVLNAECGETVYFTVAAEYDYMITDIAVVSAEGTNLVVSPTLREKRIEDNLTYYTYAFEMPAENVLIDVYTAPKTFKVSVEEDLPEGGEYTINGYFTNNLMILQGEEVTIDVTPYEGYTVTGISGTYIDNLGNVADLGGTFENNAYTFTMIAKDVSIVIDYEPIAYVIDLQTSNEQTYKPDASQNPAKVIESLDEATTSMGRIDLVDGALIDYTNELAQVYKIPANGEAIIGTRIAFTVTEYTGYDLDKLTVTYADGEKSCPLTFKDGVYYFDMPADNVVITATFVEETYTVTKDAASEEHGQVELNALIENAIAVDYKDTVDVLVTPDDGYQITSIYYVLADGTVVDFDAASYAPTETLTDALDAVQSISFHMPASDVTVYVEYAPIAYSVTDVCEEATATYTTPHTVGEQVLFTTEANYGYIITAVYAVNDFTGERVNLHTDSTNTLYGASYYFTMPAAPVTIHVETVEDTYNVIYMDNGSFIAGEDVDYLDTADVAGHVADVVNGKPGYHFVGWISADVQTPVTEPSVDNADFVIVAETIIRAAYEKDEIDVFFTATENGTVTEQSTGNTAEYRLDTTVFGDKVSFTAEPAMGYVVDTVTVTSTNAEGYNLDIRYTLSGGVYTFTIPATYKDDIHDIQAEDVIVSVTFKKDTFTLTRADDCETNGTVAINGAVTTQTSFSYEYQDEVIITATPDAGYYVAAIVVKDAAGKLIFSGSAPKPETDDMDPGPLSLSFQMPALDLFYTVDYEKIDYSITPVFNAEQGTVEVAETAQIDDVVTVTVTPKIGYDLVSLTATYDNGESSLLLTEQDDGTYTFTMPAKPVTVTALFTEHTYTADLTVVGEAAVTLNGFYTYNVTAEYLDTVTINVEPALGWELVSITINDGAIQVNEELKPEGGDYTFTMPNEDVAITVKVEKTGFGMEAFALNFYEDGHGVVTLSPEKTACVGDRIVISADPDDGYRVKEVVVLDEYGYAVPVSFIGGTPGYLETYSFTMPAFDVEIFVYFEVQGSSFYTDVRTDFWFYEAVTFVTDRGYFKGITPELFAPYKNMDRAMFVTVLGRISEIDTSKYTDIAFTDVAAGSYYAPYVAWAAENDIVLGRNATTFDPHADITREEMAAIMYRYCKYLGVDMKLENQEFMDRYEDVGDISPWALEYVKWAVGVGLIRGMSPTTIDPLGCASRAQVAQIVKNLCDKVFYQ